MKMKQPVLILVHPGSLCGSANANIGKLDANCVREEIAIELDRFNGSILVLDGEFSDELPYYSQLDKAIKSCVERCAKTGFGERLEADDPVHIKIAVDSMTRLNVPKNAEIKLTGAWHHPDETAGCVTMACKALKEAGYINTKVMDSAATIDSDQDSQDWDRIEEWGDDEAEGERS